MDKNSWVIYCALAVVACGLLSAILFIAHQPDYGFALLALALSGGATALLLAAQGILSNLSEIHHGMVAFNSEESRDFVAAVDSSYARERASEVAAPMPSPYAPSPQTNISASISAPSSAPEPMPESQWQPPASVSAEPASKKKESYKPLAGLSLSAPAPSPVPAKNFEETLGQEPEPPSVAASAWSAPAPAPVEQPPSVEVLETTQSFLPSGSQQAGARQPEIEPQAAEPPIESTIGFAAAALDIAPPRQSEPARLPSEEKARTKLGRKRYSTFAGLSLGDSGPMKRVEPVEERLTPPPLPPPAARGKEKRRYSTFAGLALNDRSSPSPVASPQAELPKSKASPIPAPAPEPLPAANLQFAKAADPVLPQLAARSEPAPIPARPAPVAPTAPAPKVSRKRYQTFMGLSLSKTPQTIKRAEEQSDSTGPLPVGLGGSPPTYSTSRPFDDQPQPQTAINKGQMGNLVDGFCSLCGSPQAAGNDYSGAQSEPEFCWYCGAKLRTQ